MEEEKKEIMTNGQPDGALFQDACQIIEQAQAAAYHAVDVTLIKRNWLLGMRIQREVLKDKRAEYGEQVVKNLAEGLRLVVDQRQGAVVRPSACPRCPCRSRM